MQVDTDSLALRKRVTLKHRAIYTLILLRHTSSYQTPPTPG